MDETQWDHPDIPPPPPRVPHIRNGGTRRFESPRTQDLRDAWAAARWSLNGWPYRQIADAMDISVSTAHDSVQRGLRASREIAEATKEQARAAHRARLEAAMEVAVQEMYREHPLVSHGRIIKDDHGVPLLDAAANLSAADKVRALSESLRKLDGLDAATKVDTTVTVAPQAAELQERLARARAAVAAEEQALRNDET